MFRNESAIDFSGRCSFLTAAILRIQHLRESGSKISKNALQLPLAIVLASSALVGFAASSTDEQVPVVCDFDSLAVNKTSPWSGSKLFRAISTRPLSFGASNLTLTRSGRDELEIAYPAGSIDPAAVLKLSRPMGGVGFRIPTSDFSYLRSDKLGFTFSVRFSEDFDFRRGGKLHGIYGGRANTGRKIPNGEDGFSVRVVWKENGYGAVYAYLPTSKNGFGTLFGIRSWQFVPNKDTELSLWIRLNQPHRNDGEIALWVNNKMVMHQADLTFRTSHDLKIDGFLGNTFFGGSDPSWASTRDVQSYLWGIGVFGIDQQAMDRCLTTLESKNGKR